MKAGRAFVAGMVGGAAMSAVMWMGRSLRGMDVNLSMMLGTMFVQPPGGTAWIVGFIMHLMISGLIALIYASAFEHVTHRSGWGIGMLFSLVHSIGTGLFMGMVPAMHPMIKSGQMPAPGMFMAHKGAMYVVMLFVLHAIYGAIVGGMYGDVVHPQVVGTIGVPDHA
ncbi:MAG: hypothetical protein HOQ30_02980 [Gemmatimonadaceae bacterium]|nr:hypothetical protein [Gemmatimonadaceae bacterium]